MGSTVTITLDHPGTPGSPDFFTTRIVEELAPWDVNSTYIYLNLTNTFDILTGDVINITDGITEKNLIVSNLAFTEQNVDTDTVSGVASPGAQVNIWACDNTGTCTNRHITADGNGNWMADFAHVGTQPDEQTMADLLPGYWVDSELYDEDGDRTMFGKSIPNPRFSVRFPENQVHGHEWPAEASVTLTIDDPILPGTVDYTNSQIAGPDGFVVFIPDGFQLKPGQSVMLTDGNTTKSHTISAIQVTRARISIRPAKPMRSGPSARGVCPSARCASCRSRTPRRQGYRPARPAAR